MLYYILWPFFVNVCNSLWCFFGTVMNDRFCTLHSKCLRTFFEHATTTVLLLHCDSIILGMLSPYVQITHTHPFNGLLSRTARVRWYQKDKTNLDFTEARDSEWQWHQLGHMQVCTLLQTDNHTSTPPLSFLQAGCPSCRPSNSVKALKVPMYVQITEKVFDGADIQIN